MVYSSLRTLSLICCSVNPWRAPIVTKMVVCCEGANRSWSKTTFENVILKVTAEPKSFSSVKNHARISGPWKFLQDMKYDTYMYNQWGRNEIFLGEDLFNKNFWNYKFLAKYISTIQKFRGVTSLWFSPVPPSLLFL